MAEEQPVRQELYFELVNSAIDVCLANQEEFKGMCSFLGRVNFSKRYRTVHIDLGRQVGKSVYVHKSAKQGDLVVVSSDATRRAMLADGALGNVCYPLDVWKMNGEFYHRIFIDEPKACFGAKLDDAFAHLAAPCEMKQVFVLLGE